MKRKIKKEEKEEAYPCPARKTISSPVISYTPCKVKSLPKSEPITKNLVDKQSTLKKITKLSSQKYLLRQLITKPKLYQF